jgi:hypothetical protein
MGALQEQLRELRLSLEDLSEDLSAFSDSHADIALIALKEFLLWFRGTKKSHLRAPRL